MLSIARQSNSVQPSIRHCDLIPSHRHLAGKKSIHIYTSERISEPDAVCYRASPLKTDASRSSTTTVSSQIACPGSPHQRWRRDALQPPEVLQLRQERMHVSIFPQRPSLRVVECERASQDWSHWFTCSSALMFCYTPQNAVGLVATPEAGTMCTKPCVWQTIVVALRVRSCAFSRTCCVPLFVRTHRRFVWAARVLGNSYGR